MPFYEYSCSACGHQLEVLQKMSDVPLTECPTCHQPALNKLVSAAGFQLKGTGWYATDFKNKGKPEQKADKNSNTSSANSTSSADSTGSASSETSVSTKAKDDSSSSSSSSSSSTGGTT